MKYVPLIYQRQIRKFFGDKFIRLTRFLILFTIDAVIILSSVVGAFLLRFDFSLPEVYLSFIRSYGGIIMLLKLSTFYAFKMYRGLWRYTSLADMFRIMKACTLASLLTLAMVAFLHGLMGFPRSVLLIDYFLTTVLVGMSRVSIRVLHSHRLHPVNISLKRSDSKKSRKKLILIGAGHTGEKILREIRENASTKFEVVGFLDDNSAKQGATIHGKAVIGTAGDLPTLNTTYDEILITIPSASRNEMRRIVELCEASGRVFRTVPALSELIDGDVTLNTIREVSIVDLLGREEIHIDRSSIEAYLQNKRVLVTGAGGSIGSELVKQCLNFQPASLVLLDISEHNLFTIDNECHSSSNTIPYDLVLGDIRDRETVERIFLDSKPHVVFHAAAYKHVPMQELHPWEAVFTNIQGTVNLIEATELNDVERFVLVSTDKAVRPANVMGATKHVAEMLIQTKGMNSRTAYMAVRFGNVIGSSGSVIPIFQEQIKKGGPITITHPDMKRYFMSIAEAAQLILQAGAIGKGGEVFILDMGDPISIKDLAYELVRLSGLEPEVDIPIEYIGIRSGEKMFEELIDDTEKVERTGHQKIMVVRTQHIHKQELTEKTIEELIAVGNSYDPKAIKKKLQHIVPEYDPFSP